MHRSVRTFLPVVGDADAIAAAFDDDPQRWLPAARREGPDRFMFAVRGGSMSRLVHAMVGSPWRAGTTRWRTFSWDPTPVENDGAAAIDRLLPSLEGEIGLHLESLGRITLVLDGRYEPPGGPLGAAADTVALQRVARGTVERFLEEVAARLAAEALLVTDDAPAPALEAQPPRQKNEQKNTGNARNGRPDTGYSAARNAPRHHRAPPVAS